MAGQENFAGFDVAQQNHYYWYWQRWGVFPIPNENEGHLCSISWIIFSNLQTVALKIGVLKQLKQTLYLLLTSREGERALWFWMILLPGLMMSFLLSPSPLPRVKQEFQPHQGYLFDNWYEEQQHNCCSLSGYSCGFVVNGNEHNLSACGNSGHPTETSVMPEVSPSEMKPVLFQHGNIFFLSSQPPHTAIQIPTAVAFAPSFNTRG